MDWSKETTLPTSDQESPLQLFLSQRWDTRQNTSGIQYDTTSKHVDISISKMDLSQARYCFVLCAALVC